MEPPSSNSDYDDTSYLDNGQENSPPVKGVRFEVMDNDVTLKEFVELNIGRLPLIMCVTSGYLGPDDVHTFSSDEVMMIHSVMSQKRVILRDDNSRLLSLPEDHELLFRILRTQGEPTMPMKLVEIIRQYGIFGLKLRCETPPDVNICLGNNLDNITKFSDMTIIDVYDERYLLANSILDTQLFLKPVMAIPAYVDISIAGVIGAEGWTSAAWQKQVTLFNNRIKKVDTSDVKLCREIILFGETELPESDYDYIEPKNFLFSLDNTRGSATNQATPSKTAPKRFVKLKNMVKKVKTEISKTVKGKDKPPSRPPRMVKDPPRLKTFKAPFPLPDSSSDEDYEAVDLYGPESEPTPREHSETEIKANTEISHEAVQAETQEEVDLYEDVWEAENIYDQFDESAMMVKTPLVGMPAWQREPMQKNSPRNPPFPPLATIQPFQRQLPKCSREGNKSEKPIEARPRVAAKPLINKPKREQHLPLLEQKKDNKGDVNVNLYATPASLKALTGHRFPANIRDFAVEDVMEALKTIGLQRHATVFEENQVDGKLLTDKDFDKEMLQKDFGFSKLDAIKLNKLINEGWLPKTKTRVDEQ